MIKDALGAEIKPGDTVLYALGGSRVGDCYAAYQILEAEEYTKLDRVYNWFTGEYEMRNRTHIRVRGQEIPLPGGWNWSELPQPVTLKYPNAAIIITGLDLPVPRREAVLTHE